MGRYRLFILFPCPLVFVWCLCVLVLPLFSLPLRGPCWGFPFCLIILTIYWLFGLGLIPFIFPLFPLMYPPLISL